MARNYPLSVATRTGVTAADTAVPAAPEDSSGNPVLPLAAGIVATDGADKLKVDVQTPTGSTGTTSLNVYAWNSSLKAWVMDGAQLAVAAATTGDFTGRLLSRTTILNWCSRYAFVAVATLATGGGSAPGTTVSVTACMQDK